MLGSPRCKWKIYESDSGSVSFPPFLLKERKVIAVEAISHINRNMMVWLCWPKKVWVKMVRCNLTQVMRGTCCRYLFLVLLIFPEHCCFHDLICQRPYANITDWYFPYGVSFHLKNGLLCTCPCGKHGLHFLDWEGLWFKLHRREPWAFLYCQWVWTWQQVIFLCCSMFFFVCLWSSHS